ncbi:molybdopterin-binding protein [Kribbella voronezhensis]|uniref:Molybdopterin-binding protein n=1 Tax=Kribbella voronezhensis TaxID=2512212 RepID=A0A4R7TFB2_9ACTN|nr:molybdopterin-binding protein [Kribbella voronezhensis]
MPEKPPQAIRRYGAKITFVPNLRISEAAALLGVSDDTVRRWIEQGRLPAVQDGGRMAVDGRELAAFAQKLAESPDPGTTTAASARNRLRGIVTRVVKDGVMAQVELQAGPFRVVSLMSREAADELELEPGVIAVASIKSTHVVVEIPES